MRQQQQRIQELKELYKQQTGSNDIFPTLQKEDMEQVLELYNQSNVCHKTLTSEIIQEENNQLKSIDQIQRKQKFMKIYSYDKNNQYLIQQVAQKLQLKIDVLTNQLKSEEIFFAAKYVQNLSLNSNNEIVITFIGFVSQSLMAQFEQQDDLNEYYYYGAGLLKQSEVNYYVGQFYRGEKVYGKHIIQNKQEYNGYFEKNLPNGFGYLKYQNEEFYRGDFKNGIYHGKGEYQQLNRNKTGQFLLSKGTWTEGKRNGQFSIENLHVQNIDENNQIQYPALKQLYQQSYMKNIESVEGSFSDFGFTTKYLKLIGNSHLKNLLPEFKLQFQRQKQSILQNKSKKIKKVSNKNKKQQQQNEEEELEVKNIEKQYNNNNSEEEKFSQQQQQQQNLIKLVSYKEQQQQNKYYFIQNEKLESKINFDSNNAQLIFQRKYRLQEVQKQQQQQQQKSKKKNLEEEEEENNQSEIVELNREEINCSICFEELIAEDSKSQQKLKCFPCNGNHFFHQKCIDKWILQKSTCPECRFDLVKDLDADNICGEGLKNKFFLKMDKAVISQDIEEYELKQQEKCQKLIQQQQQQNFDGLELSKQTSFQSCSYQSSSSRNNNNNQNLEVIQEEEDDIFKNNNQIQQQQQQPQMQQQQQQQQQLQDIEFDDFNFNLNLNNNNNIEQHNTFNDLLFDNYIDGLNHDGNNDMIYMNYDDFNYLNLDNNNIIEPL